MTRRWPAAGGGARPLVLPGAGPAGREGRGQQPQPGHGRGRARACRPRGRGNRCGRRRGGGRGLRRGRPGRRGANRRGGGGALGADGHLRGHRGPGRDGGDAARRRPGSSWSAPPAGCTATPGFRLRGQQGRAARRSAGTPWRRVLTALASPESRAERRVPGHRRGQAAPGIGSGVGHRPAAERAGSQPRSAARPAGRERARRAKLAVTAGLVALLMLATFGYAMRTRVHAIMDTIWPLGFVLIAVVRSAVGRFRRGRAGCWCSCSPRSGGSGSAAHSRRPEAAGARPRAVALHPAPELLRRCHGVI